MLGFQQFSEYKDEIKFLINHGMHIPRKDMPQIKNDNREAFLKYLEDNNVKYQHKDITVKDYRIVQGEIDLSKVLSIISKGSRDYYPLIVSSDGFVIDGTHRFVAKYLVDKNDTAQAIVIDLSASKLLNLTNSFDRVKREGI